MFLVLIFAYISECCSAVDTIGRYDITCNSRMSSRALKIMKAFFTYLIHFHTELLPQLVESRGYSGTILLLL